MLVIIKDHAKKNWILFIFNCSWLPACVNNFLTNLKRGRQLEVFVITKQASSLGRYVFGSEISYNKAPPRLPGLGC